MTVADSTAPVVTNVTSSASDGSYRAGDSIFIEVEFIENVTVTGTPSLSLNSGGVATYSSGSGSNKLIFSYTIRPGDDVCDRICT